jgi:hypothetical protein
MTEVCGNDKFSVGLLLSRGCGTEHDVSGSAAICIYSRKYEVMFLCKVLISSTAVLNASLSPPFEV